MNEPESNRWSANQQHYDPMNSQVPETDFSNFLDLDLGDLEFAFDGGNGAPTREPSQQLNELPDALTPQHAQQQFRSAQHSTNPQETSNGLIYDMNIPMYANAQPQYSFQGDQHRFVPHSAIPPTPSSLEIHAGARFNHTQHPQRHAQQPPNQALYQIRKDDAASFTPLVSPAVTPQDAAFRLQQEFTVPGSYLSPLTSPMMEAQRQRQSNQHTPGNSGSSAATSPTDADIEMLEANSQAPARKAKSSAGNRRNLGRSTAAVQKVAQSPIHRPRRKSKPAQSITPKEVAMLREAEATRSSSGLDVPHHHHHRSQESSEASISPEPLTESLMGPPPRPISQSPNFAGKRMQGQENGVAPATPASLMRLQKSTDETPTVSLNQDGANAPILEDLKLPEAAAQVRPGLSRGVSQEDGATPRLMARKTPKLGPLMTPSAGAALSGRPSPSLSALTSPTTPVAQSPIAGRRVEPKGRSSKKRNSTSSTLVSPALRPKISPSIKPLLPEGAQGMTDEHHTFLLASKSNYQNILDGTHVPGVNYPEALSTNLTSKRTSHKIAEQGRRNRINEALRTMQALLPSPIGPNGSSKSPSGEANSPEEESAAPGATNGKTTNNNQSNSKAATVEQAIDYIKDLQKEKVEWDQEREDKDRELEELRRKMKEMESKLRADSETSA